ncbi:MAG: formylglycine-generating enzyme family protein, partial [Synechococcales cyanobacterium]
MIGVSWNDAKEFIRRLNEKTGKRYRLPTEAEWEYAARAGTTTPFSYGATITPEVVNYYGSFPYGNAPKGEFRERTMYVNSLYPNPWGLYHIHGNVFEWVEDYFHDNYEGAPTDGSAWLTGGNQLLRVLRGGSWHNLSDYCRSASRVRNPPVNRLIYFGFR